MKHFIIAAYPGRDESVKELKFGYAKGFMNEDGFAAALRANQAAVGAMKRGAADEQFWWSSRRNMIIESIIFLQQGFLFTKRVTLSYHLNVHY